MPIIEEKTVNTVQELNQENEMNSMRQSSSESSEKRISATLILNLLNQSKPRKSSKDVPQWLLKEARFYLINVLQHIANAMLDAVCSFFRPSAPKEKYRTPEERNDMNHRRKAAYERLQQRQAESGFARRRGRGGGDNPWRSKR